MVGSEENDLKRKAPAGGEPAALLLCRLFINASHGAIPSNWCSYKKEKPPQWAALLLGGSRPFAATLLLSWSFLSGRMMHS